MKFVTVTAKNFLAFEEVSYNFVDKPILIQGQNLDESDSQESNGSGKSGLFNMIELCLFNEVSRDSNIAELVMFEQDQADLSLTIFCPTRNQSLLIERRIHKTKGGSSQLSVNGLVKYGFEDKMVSEINSFILDWMNSNKKDIQSFYVINGENVKPLFKLSNTDLINLISRFSNANLIEGVDKFVTEDVVIQEQVIKKLENERSEYVGKIKAFREQIEEELIADFEQQKADKIFAKQELITQNVTSIESIKEDIDILNEENGKLVLKIEETGRYLVAVEKTLSEKSSISFENQYKELDGQISTVIEQTQLQQQENSKVKKQLDETESLLMEINRNIKGSVVCPKCSHKFLVSDPEIDIEEEKEQLPKVEMILKKVGDRMRSISMKIKEFDLQISQLNKQKGVIQQQENEHREQVRKIKNQITEVEDSIENLKKTINRNKSSIENKLNSIDVIQENIKLAKQQIEALKTSVKDESRVTNLNVSIAENEKLITSLEEKLVVEETKLFELKQWVFNFRKFNGYLANQSLKVIQGYVNKYLIDMQSDIQVRIEGFKENPKTGELSDKITPYIIRDGITRKYGSFSKGERGRINLATTMAIQGIMNKSNKFGGLTQLFLDEFAEGCDPKGIGLIIKSAQKLNFPLMMTTHVTDREAVSDILIVRKENKVSTLINT